MTYSEVIFSPFCSFTATLFSCIIFHFHGFGPIVSAIVSHTNKDKYNNKTRNSGILLAQNIPSNLLVQVLFFIINLASL